jgi:vancomycin permeability regulator SanA
MYTDAFYTRDVFGNELNVILHVAETYHCRRAAFCAYQERLDYLVATVSPRSIIDAVTACPHEQFLPSMIGQIYLSSYYLE